MPEQGMYWSSTDKGIFKALDYGMWMSRDRFEDIQRYLQFSSDENKDVQIIKFLDAVNTQLKTAMIAGDVLVVDESMVKSFHRNLKGKMKIIRKPRPLGNKFKTLCDGRSKVVLHIEF